MNKIRQRWADQYRMYRRCGKVSTERCPLVRLALYGNTKPGQRVDMLALRARWLAAAGAQMSVQRADIVRNTHRSP